MEKVGSKITVPVILQIITLVLALICITVNSSHYEFPRLFLPFIYELEAVAISFIFLVYIVTFCLNVGENSFLLLMAVSAFHGIIFLIISSAMLATFTGEIILGFESEVWNTTDKKLMVTSGALGILTSAFLIAEAITCFMGHVAEESNKN